MERRKEAGNKGPRIVGGHEGDDSTEEAYMRMLLAAVSAAQRIVPPVQRYQQSGRSTPPELKNKEINQHNLCAKVCLQ